VATTQHLNLSTQQTLQPPSALCGRSTCDSICGRLLAPLIKQLLKVKAHEGQACAQEVLGWCRQDNLWLRRSSVVAFVTLAKLPDDKVRPGQYLTVVSPGSVLVQCVVVCCSRSTSRAGCTRMQTVVAEAGAPFAAARFAVQRLLVCCWLPAC
jgi:hypothetical protein